MIIQLMSLRKVAITTHYTLPLTLFLLSSKQLYCKRLQCCQGSSPGVAHPIFTPFSFAILVCRLLDLVLLFQT